MKIGFYVDSEHGDAILDPDYCEHHPLGGSETAVVKMSHCLRRLGAEVSIVTRYEALSSLHCDIFISLRAWKVFADGLKPGKLNYLWCQDDSDQPVVVDLMSYALAQRVYQACDGIILISYYQSYRWLLNLHAPVEKIFISSNGVDLPKFRIDAASLTRRSPRAYYASTPFRGLSILLNLWPQVRSAIGDRARLTVCSSLKVYGMSEEATYGELYEKARQTEGVEYLGSVGQAQLREIAASSRALAYPCIFPETGCIAAMEAMASGCAVVGTALGALPETAWRNPLAPLSDGWADVWLEELIRTLVDDHYYRQIAESNLHLALHMGWSQIAKTWLMRFRSDTVKRASLYANAPAELVCI